ncbi:MAG: branched-chain amino acid ABC transporter permease [Candidatus Ventricola sp.]
MAKMKKSSVILTCLLLALLCGALFAIDGHASNYIIRITRLCAINIVLALSMNLVNGFTGIFSLGHAGFMAVGAYTVALLTIPVAKKETIFMLEPLIAPLNTLTLPFGAALVIGGLLAAGMAFFIGLPCLRLRGDYLAIATLGFSEIIRIVITNAQCVTNGAQGLKSIPKTADIWWCYGIALAVLLFMCMLISSSYGRALKAIREDEIAAESMGISLLRHKMLAFMLSAFLAGVGGGLYASYIGTIGPDVFQVSRTYDILMIVVMGGMGSISGSVIAAFIVTIGQEWLRVLDGPLPFLPFWPENGVSGMRMVVFSILLLVVILFFRNGLFGHKEVTWSSIGRRLAALSGHRVSKGGERA